METFVLHKLMVVERNFIILIIFIPYLRSVKTAALFSFLAVSVV